MEEGYRSNIVEELVGRTTSAFLALGRIPDRGARPGLL